MNRFQWLNQVVDSHLKTLRPSEIAVLLVLFRDAKWPGGTLRSSHTYIAARCHLHPVTVYKAMAYLRAAGLVKTIKQGGPNAGIAISVLTLPTP